MGITCVLISHLIVSMSPRSLFNQITSCLKILTLEFIISDSNEKETRRVLRLKCVRCGSSNWSGLSNEVQYQDGIMWMIAAIQQLELQLRSPNPSDNYLVLHCLKQYAILYASRSTSSMEIIDILRIALFLASNTPNVIFNTFNIPPFVI